MSVIGQASTVLAVGPGRVFGLFLSLTLSLSLSLSLKNAGLRKPHFSISLIIQAEYWPLLFNLYVCSRASVNSACSRSG